MALAKAAVISTSKIGVAMLRILKVLVCVVRSVSKCGGAELGVEYPICQPDSRQTLSLCPRHEENYHRRTAAFDGEKWRDDHQYQSQCIDWSSGSELKR